MFCNVDIRDDGRVIRACVGFGLVGIENLVFFSPVLAPETVRYEAESLRCGFSLSKMKLRNSGILNLILFFCRC